MTDVKIDYTNWRGERGFRIITPVRIYFGSNEYHKTPQWLLRAFDIEKLAVRTFALKDIHHWDGPIVDLLQSCLVSLPKQNDDNPNPVPKTSPSG